MIGRTEIAAMALQGLLGGPDGPEWSEIKLPLLNGTALVAAQWAVGFADALLYELSKIPPPASIESPKEGPPSGCTAGAAGDAIRGSTAIESQIRAELGPEPDRATAAAI